MSTTLIGQNTDEVNAAALPDGDPALGREPGGQPESAGDDPALGREPEGQPESAGDDPALSREPGGQPELAGGDPALSREPEDDPEEDLANYFDTAEADALGEIGNICMGTSATTMYTLIGRRVTITTPAVAMCRADKVLAGYNCPFLAVSVEFIKGIHGKNLLILKDYDVALITDLLMGGDGMVDPDNIDLNELHFSAMSEVMNQMMGSAATAMSNMLGSRINISPPQVSRIEYYESVARFLDGASPVVKISFDMEIEGLLKSKLLQIMTVEMARELINLLMHPEEKEESEEMVEEPMQAMDTQVQKPEAAVANSDINYPVDEKQHVTAVKHPTYQSFDPPLEAATANQGDMSNFDLINDIPLQVTVELGKAKKNLNDVLNLGIGAIVVLDKQAGDLVEVIVNGKRFAKGEVVVIDENYGVRITDIIKPKTAGR